MFFNEANRSKIDKHFLKSYSSAYQQKKSIKILRSPIDQLCNLSLQTQPDFYRGMPQACHGKRLSLEETMYGGWVLSPSQSLDYYYIFPQISNGSLDYFHPTDYEARYVRFTVKTWYQRACMRVGILNGKLHTHYISSNITLAIRDHKVYF